MGSVFFRHPSRYNIKLTAGYLIIATPAPTVNRTAKFMITTVQRDLQRHFTQTNRESKRFVPGKSKFGRLVGVFNCQTMDCLRYIVHKPNPVN